MKRTLLALALACCASAASAHRPWMLPTGTNIETREPVVTIDCAISDDLFEFDHLPLKMDGASVTDPDGLVTPLPAGQSGRFRSSVDLALPKNGTYRIALVNATVMGSYKLNGELKRVRSTEAAFAKEVPAGATEVQSSTQFARLETFVTANKASMGAFRPTGQGLEMIPLTNPTELHAGETARLRFTLDGKALANFPFSLIPGGVRYRGVLGELRFTTDARGEASVRLPAPNQYLLSASYPAEQAKAPPADGARRYSYSATLAVLPE